MKIDTDQSILSNIHPRLCILHKWSHFDGYGIHLSCNEHWRGLHIEHIEPNSPAESAGLLRKDIILAVNGHSIENEDFFVILSFIQHALKQDQIRFLVLDPYSVELAQRYQLNIDENNENCIRIETSQFIKSQELEQNLSHDELDDINKLFSNLDLHNNLKSDPRICSITLPPSAEPIGISLKSDTDFSHIITQVRTNSLADRAGIEKDDCIISLNNILLLQVSFEDVLYYLAKSRKEKKLNFLVAKKSYLLKLSPNQLPINPVFSLSNSTQRNRSSTLPNTKTLEHLERNQQQTKRHGKTLDGISSHTTLRFSWSATNDKIIDYSSIRSNLYGRRSDIDEIKKRHSTMKNTLNSLQVGMTNPSPKSQIRRFPSHLPNVSFSDDEQRTVQSIGRLHNSPKLLPSPNPAMRRNHIIHTPSPSLKHNQTIQNILNAVSITPIQSSPTLHIREKDNHQTSQSNLHLDVSTSENIFDEEENKSSRTLERSKTSTSWDSDKQMVIISTDSQSVSSIADQQIENQSSIATFYIINETETRSNTFQQYVENDSDNQQISNVSNQFSDQQQSSAEMAFATMPISELSNHGYELHNIKLMKPTETIPVGFKLTKQTDPFQYIITALVEQSKADIAGLKIDDWLIKIEDNDIRLTDLENILENIYRLFNIVGSINMLIARKKSTKIINNQSISAEMNSFSSIGLSNPTSSTEKEDPIIQSTDSNLDKIRHITLKQTSGLYINSFKPNNNDQIQVHFITNIQPISAAYRSGLRNNDRILTVNDVDVTNTSQEDLRLMILKTKPVELTVIKDSKYLESIENYKRNENQKTSSQAINKSTDRQESKDLDNIIFIDEQGPVYLKHCIVKRGSSHNALGFLLHYEDGFHIINNIDINYPGYKSGLRDNDIILFINKKNIQQMTHDNVTILLRSLVSSNEIVDLIIIKKTDLQRYKNYQRKKIINWNNIFSKIHDEIQSSEENFRSLEPSSPPLIDGARICVVETVPNRSIGFTVERVRRPPFPICKIEKDSPAEKAGLQSNDSLLSINGRSLLQTSYEDTIKLIKDALQQKTIQFLVKKSSIKQKTSSLSYTSGDDYGTSTDDDSNVGDKTTHRDTNPVQQYQRKRSKELSYTLRLCHLNATNIDGTPASSFGFEITEDSQYQYPIISRVERKSPGERSGLQKDDILLKVNDRKTKGADFDKIRKAIERAKRDGRLEMLVADKETFNYCIKLNKKFKEPYIKVKHIFPRSKPSKGYQSLPIIAGKVPMVLQKSLERSISSTGSSNGRHLSTHSESEEDDLLSPIPHDISSKFIDPARRLSPRMDISSPIQNTSNTTQEIQNASNTIQEIQNETSSDESMMDSVLNAVNNFFQKPINLDYDLPPDRTNNSKVNTPLLPIFSKGIRSNQSSASYDYIKDPRRCVLKIDRNKGLGFVLSATGDYDHTITAVDKNSIADVAGLQVNDEVVEINGIDVRNMKYEKVVDMLISSMQTNDTIEMCVIDNHISLSRNGTNNHILLNNNNNNNNNLIAAKHKSNDLSAKNSPLIGLKQQTINTSYPDLYDRSKFLSNISNRGLSGSVPILSTGITASPKDFRSILSKDDSTTKVLNISEQHAPIARLCRIRKFPTSPFYGFFLCGNPKKLGRVFVSNITKNSSAAVCGLRDGDRIIEVNGTNIQTLTYETILNKIKLHMENHDLELLVLDKKSLHWYRKRNHPITSQTLPTIVHIEPIINDMNSEIQCSSEL